MVSRFNWKGWLSINKPKRLYILWNNYGYNWLTLFMLYSKTAWRYRLHNKAVMILLVNCVNGLVRHSTRLQQLRRVCFKMNIKPLNPIFLVPQSNWFAEFFDTSGTITLSMKNSVPQLTVSVTNKNLVDVEHFLILGYGSIYFYRTQNGYYKWTIQFCIDK